MSKLSEKRRVVLIKSNLIERDSRVLKERESLTGQGYYVTFLCWDRDRKSLEPDAIDKYREIRLQLKSPWGIKVLPFLPIWWCFVFIRMMMDRWDIAHAINFDSIIPAVIAGKLKRKPVIYEIEDAYEDEVVLPRIIRNISIRIDKLLMPLASAVVIIDEAQVREFSGIPNLRVVPIYDTPPETFSMVNARSQENEIFTIFYAGVFFKARRMNLDRVVAAISNIDNVRLVISGYGDQVEEIKEWSHQMAAKVEFLGFVSNEEVWQRSCTADLLLVARTPAILGYRYNCGSTFLRAMMCGRPFLANRGTATADKVIQENCGLVADAGSVDEIRGAIVRLKENPQLREELGANARKAYEQRYSWQIMEGRLITLYRDLLSG